MTAVDLSQFASLFEIGFALHIAVAFLDRIYARELPVRIDGIAGRATSLEQLKKEISPDPRSAGAASSPEELRFAHRTIADPVWNRHNDHVLDRVYALLQDVNGQMKTLRRTITALTFFSIVVALYSVAVLFLIGLGLELVKGLDPFLASTVVLTQLLPLPTAAAVVFVYVRRISHDIDRRIRGIGELQLMLNQPDSSTTGDASVDQVYRRGRERIGLMDDI